MGVVGGSRLKVLTGETSLKQVLAIILVFFSVGYGAPISKPICFPHRAKGCLQQW